jgi:hypothetical protein
MPIVKVVNITLAWQVELWVTYFYRNKNIRSQNFWIHFFIHFFASKTRVVGEYTRSTSGLSRLKRADVTGPSSPHVHQSLVAADEEAMGLRTIKPVVARPRKHHCSQQARNSLRRASLLLSFSFALADQRLLLHWFCYACLLLITVLLLLLLRVG